MTEKIMLAQTKCQYCEQQVTAQQELFDDVWQEHLEKCEKFKEFERKIRDLDAKGILKPYMKFLRSSEIEKDLRKIIHKYKTTSEELIKILEEINEEAEQK